MLDGWFWVWSILAAALLVGEILTAGFFLLPFGIGAAVAAALAFFEFTELTQTVSFIVVSGVAFILLRMVASKLTHEPPVKTGADRLVGKRGIVMAELNQDDLLGRVRVEREEWRADAPEHAVVPVGTRIEVDRVEGTHLIVHPVAE